MRAAIYVRISDDRESTGLGVARQEADCRALAEQRGHEIVEVYTDNDLTAADPRKPRPGYQRLIADMEAAAWDVLIVWDLDRLHRRPAELESFFEAWDRSGQPALLNVGGEVDLATPQGRLVARMKGTVAAYEVEQLRRRIRRKAEELARAGKVGGGGTRPFGFEPDRVAIRESEAVLIREAASRVAAGETLRSVIADWTERGVETVTGAGWSHQVLRHMLCSPRIAGLRQHHGEVVAEAVWPAIVDRVTWQRVRAAIDDRAAAYAHRRASRRYLLTGGVATCGRCSNRLVARPREDGSRKYVCAAEPMHGGGCGRMAMLADPFEEWVAAQLGMRLDSDAYRQARSERNGDESEVATLMAAVERDEAMLTQLARDHYTDGLIGRGEYLAARSGLDARLAGSRRELERLRTCDVLDGLSPVSFAGDWDGMSFGQRRAIVEALIETVTVNAAVRGRNFFDPGRVAIAWRV
ncbi:MAG: recombinase family protein [Actinobacteria bacterium]|nr:recombinase family protein [Actinomycetota bacterium]